MYRLVCVVSDASPPVGLSVVTGLVATTRGFWRVFRSSHDSFVFGCIHRLHIDHSECLVWQNHEVDGMFPKLTLFQNVSLLRRTKLLSLATDSLRQYSHVEITCWPIGSYICSPGTAREVFGRYAVPKTGI